VKIIYFPLLEIEIRKNLAEEGGEGERHLAWSLFREKKGGGGGGGGDVTNIFRKRYSREKGEGGGSTLCGFPFCIQERGRRRGFLFHQFVKWTRCNLIGKKKGKKITCFET